MFRKVYNWSSTWTGTIVIVLVIMSFIAQAFVIPSGSMKNTLLIGDMLFVKKFSYGIPVPRIPWLEVKMLPDFNDNGHLIEGPRPKRGDIVVFRYPKNDAIHYVKRAVATGGDIVALKDKNLLLHPKEGNEYVKANYPKENIIEVGDKLWVVNPYKKEHPGIHNDPSVVNNGLNPSELFNMMPVLVPEDETFMMGDNRDHSNDSRFWGTVPYKFVVGTPWVIYFSWNDEKEIRWDRVLKQVDTIEEKMNTKNIEINHEKGIY
ncbi:signal peptidase I [Arcobacter peruensis]|uniref:signal peptidase I n=1 Tax=Arcobacter peruensis TaxID=2320140 RepID=UPI000F08E973|nr:signal peptidase I [Arcobacter peruensis]